MSKIIFTTAAAKRISEIKTEDKPYFRPKVTGGGCQGFNYEMDIVAEIKDDDFVVETDGEKLLVDPTSLEYLEGSTIDFIEELIGSTF